jgi:signal-transduction protein with cAMP-binding, CBS, and nucleotidyltransferase domain
MKTGVSVLDTMTNKPVTVESSTSIQDCAKLMKKEGLGSLIILDNNKITGIITQEDIVFKVTAEKLKLATPVSEIMIKDVEIVSPEEDVYEALVLLKEREIKQVPVVHNDKLIGILSVRDILQIQPELYEIMYEKGRRGIEQ